MLFRETARFSPSITLCVPVTLHFAALVHGTFDPRPMT